MSRLIAVCTVRECPGKTSLGLNLALAMSSRSRQKTAILDLSFSGRDSVGALLGVKFDKTAKTLNDAMPSLDPALLKGYLPDCGPNLAVLEGLPSRYKKLLDPLETARIVKAVSSAYPLSIVLLPDIESPQIRMLSEISDLVLLFLTPDHIALIQGAEYFDAVKDWSLSPKKLRTIICDTGAPDSIEKAVIEGKLGAEIFFELPYDRELLVSCMNRGIPAVESVPGSKFSQGINLLAERLLDQALFITERENALSCDRKPGPEGGTRDAEIRLDRLRLKLHESLISEFGTRKIDLKDLSNSPEKNSEARDLARGILKDKLSKEDLLPDVEARSRLIEEMIDEAFGLGCIEKLLKDPEVTEIMVNGHENIYVERAGKIRPTELNFASEKHLMTAIDRIVSPIGRRIDESSPIVDARLGDGSRVNAVIPPLALDGPCLTVRKFSKKKLLPEDLVKFGALTSRMAEFLKICVLLKKNIIVSGGTGSGKTTLLNVLSSFIPEEERIVTIEDSAELRLPQEHVVRLESRPPSMEGTGEISIRRLVINALRMRPDRIIVGECRGGEALDMLQAMNTGHDGSITTIHSNSPRDAVYRMATMAMMSGMDIPAKAVTEQIVSAVNIIVQLSRLSDGSRKITEIAEINGMSCEAPVINAIFKYEQASVLNGRVAGKFIATGKAPAFAGDISKHGLSVDPGMFSMGEPA